MPPILNPLGLCGGASLTTRPAITQASRGVGTTIGPTKARISPLVLSAAATASPISLSGFDNRVLPVKPLEDVRAEASGVLLHQELLDAEQGEQEQAPEAEVQASLPAVVLATAAEQEQKAEQPVVQVLAAQEAEQEVAKVAEVPVPAALSAAAAAYVPVTTAASASYAASSASDASPAETHEVISLPSSTAPPSVVAPSYVHRAPKDHNSVTIKHDTKVKDAAGAIFKVIDRLGVAFVTALRVEPTHEALNRAVKSIAVARKYVNDNCSNFEVTFLPLHRQDKNDVTRPDLFAFLVSKTAIGASSHGAGASMPSASSQLAALKMADETDLNVSRSSDINKMANAIISIVLDREQAVMKAGGAEAVHVAMSAIINARRRMQSRRGSDLMLVPSFITENTMATLGRESKFLRLNVLKCEPNGPKSDIHPSISSFEGYHPRHSFAGHH